MIAKAACHVHSHWSHDGKWTLSMLASFFKKMGYSVLFTAEHNQSFDDERWEMYRNACREAGRIGIVIVPGIEYSDLTNTVHVMVWGEKCSYLGPVKSIGTVLEMARELEGVSVVAHPSRRMAWKQIHPSWVPLLLGIEEWNRKVDGVAPSKEGTALLKENQGLEAFVGLDFHRWNQFFPLSMRVQVEGHVCEESVLNALRKRAFSARAIGIPIRRFRRGVLGKSVAALEYFRRYMKKRI